MKGHPRHILLSAVCNYLSDDERSALLKRMNTEKPKQDRKFIRILKEHFDFERMKDHPVHKEDIWLYNYLHYEVEERLLKKGLIAKYSGLIKPSNDKDIMNASIAGL